jgi:uncharacterized repeat protein (TIGR03806 family)
LSQTGCVDPADPKRPADSLVPYGIASPLWSDGAAKHRYFALPDGATIDVKDCAREPESCDPAAAGYTTLDDGHWIFPDGTVFVKTFSLGERLVETRLLVRVDEFNWWGYSYEWREDQSDAELLAANEIGYERTIGAQTWHFPSRSQCLQCHTDAAGRSLGPETSQLDHDFAYPSGVSGNQLDTLEHIGLFATIPAARPAFPDPADASAPLESRARAYLHANCAICHRPGGESSVALDLRFDAPFAATGLCNVTPGKGDLGVPGALLVAPGEPARSVLTLRMRSLDLELRMPRIGTRVVDEQGVATIEAWIASLSGCP